MLVVQKRSIILNLAIGFALDTLFAQATVVRIGGLWLDVPVLQSAVFAAMALSLAAAFAIFRFKVSVIATLLACAVAGMIWTSVA